jgi:hypothetical protein
MNPGKLSLINNTKIIDTIGIVGNLKNILFNSINGLAYITKENDYYYSTDVFEDKLLKTIFQSNTLYLQCH